MTPPTPLRTESLLPLRTAVVLLWALVAAVTIGGVTFVSGVAPAGVVLAALGTAGSAALGFHKAIGH